MQCLPSVACSKLRSMELGGLLLDAERQQGIAEEGRLMVGICMRWEASLLEMTRMLWRRQR